MTGGRLTIGGSAGHWAASGMKGGEIEIPARPATASAGRSPVRSRACAAASSSCAETPARAPPTGCGAARSSIEGGAGEHAGSRMIAGDADRAARGRCAAGLSDEARDDRSGRGRAPLVADFRRLRHASARRDAADGRLSQAVQRPTAALLRGPMRRFAGDMAVFGKRRDIHRKPKLTELRICLRVARTLRGLRP